MEPAGKVWDHWVVWNIPPETTHVPADWDSSSVDAVQGRNDYGEVGYGGPNPPDREHTYQFVVRALDTGLALDRGETKAELEMAIEGHVLDEARLTGTYAP
jgi:Raf kinase inhibitor-like YbhB/YbcL family protein